MSIFYCVSLELDVYIVVSTALLASPMIEKLPKTVNQMTILQGVFVPVSSISRRPNNWLKILDNLRIDLAAFINLPRVTC